MLDNIPQDQAFTQLIITQLRSYHDKCLSWYKGKYDLCLAPPFLIALLAMAGRAQADGSISLKPAVAIMEAGDLSIVVQTIWNGEESDRARLMQKVF
jgi:hypothetical protein